MQAAFDEALAYATDRETFGKAIAKHQLVQEKLYDMRVGLETSRQLSRRAARSPRALRTRGSSRRWRRGTRARRASR